MKSNLLRLTFGCILMMSSYKRIPFWKSYIKVKVHLKTGPKILMKALYEHQEVNISHLWRWSRFFLLLHQYVFLSRGRDLFSPSNHVSAFLNLANQNKQCYWMLVGKYEDFFFLQLSSKNQSVETLKHIFNLSKKKRLVSR